MIFITPKGIQRERVLRFQLASGKDLTTQERVEGILLYTLKQAGSTPAEEYIEIVQNRDPDLVPNARRAIRNAFEAGLIDDDVAAGEE